VPKHDFTYKKHSGSAKYIIVGINQPSGGYIWYIKEKKPPTYELLGEL